MYVTEVYNNYFILGQYQILLAHKYYSEFRYYTAHEHQHVNK